MNTAELISSLESQGVRLSVDAAGVLRCHGDRAKVNAALPKLKARKPELLVLLSTKPPAPSAPPLDLSHTPARSADHAHAEYVRDMIHAGWVWHGGRWHAPGASVAAQDAQQPQPLPMPHPEPQPAPQPATVGGLAIRCADCRHAIADSYHPALATCGAGRESPAASGFWWTLDRRDCGRFEATVKEFQL